MSDDLVAQIGGVSALAEPARRALYFYVIAQPKAVSRDQAAEGAALPRHTAKFHLDKLVEEGLLDTEFRRLSGRAGPGAGRPSKLYRRSARQVEVTLPERHYDLAAQILARAIEESASEGKPVQAAVGKAAADAGRWLAVGSHVTRDGGTGAPPVRLSEVAELLAEQGYEPRVADDQILLANCPFHALATQHTALVCGMNVDLITALLDELGAADIEARLDPGPGRCCVTLGRRLG